MNGNFRPEHLRACDTFNASPLNHFIYPHNRTALTVRVNDDPALLVTSGDRKFEVARINTMGTLLNCEGRLFVELISELEEGRRLPPGTTGWLAITDEGPAIIGRITGEDSFPRDIAFSTVTGVSVPLEGRIQDFYFARYWRLSRENGDGSRTLICENVPAA